VVALAFRSSANANEPRYLYQQQFIRHQFRPGERVLDIGSGGDPFPQATILADRYLEPTSHRSSRFDSQGKPVVICDIHSLPFPDQAFDYAVASHVLEHVENPLHACRELQRVARAGFIETPAILKDTLFAWAKGMHKWHVVAIANRLVFFEYSQRQLEGIRSSAWHHLIFGSCYHPLQEAFKDNQDQFNVMLEWRGSFEVTVMKMDGTVQLL
jgi:ubiquinone/menaquinone biosynthesis C-methylase UbiE